MNKKTLIKVCAVTCGLSLTLAGCTSSNNSNDINNTENYNTEINSQDTEKTGSKECYIIKAAMLIQFISKLTVLN